MSLSLTLKSLTKDVKKDKVEPGSQAEAGTMVLMGRETFCRERDFEPGDMIFRSDHQASFHTILCRLFRVQFSQ